MRSALRCVRVSFDDDVSALREFGRRSLRLLEDPHRRLGFIGVWLEQERDVLSLDVGDE
jgi:hypothetical protein